MVAAVKWEGVSTVTSIMTTALNSLADNTMSAASTEVDNSTGLDTVAWFELNLASLLPAVSNPRLDLYVTQAPDGTNYETAPLTGGANQRHMFVGAFPAHIVTATKRVVIGPFLLPPHKLKFYLDNQANVALGASGNTLDIIVNNYESQ